MTEKGYRFLKNIRLAGIVLLWVGLLFHSTLAFAIGVLAWAGTFIYTIEKMEAKLFHEEKKEDDDTEE